jgi:Ca2+-binding EF-hand superfamily protein
MAMKRALGTMILAALASFSGIGRAEPKAPARGAASDRLKARGHMLCPLFRQFDKNHDGKITDSEESALLVRLFVQADTDGDGRVSPSELERAVDGLVLERVSQRFAQLDRNHDGRIVWSEVSRMGAERFRRFDLDGDSVITQAELGRYMMRIASRRVSRFFALLDGDKDRQLSFSELGIVRDRRQARADAPSPPGARAR